VVDHRQSGSIGGFYGNGIGGFHAVPFAIDARYDANGNAIGLGPADPTTTLERFRDSKRDMLSVAASLDEFLAVWRWRDWNELRVRIVGTHPLVTTSINGLKIAELDMATLEAPNYDAAAVAALLGPRGHIAFEVHDNDTRFGERRWGRHAACRWRNIRIRAL
jgi:3-keto-disaccharide hydrolase